MARVLTPEEKLAMFKDDRFPPILTVHQAAKLMQVSSWTIYRWASNGRIKAAVRRNRPLRIYRDVLVEVIMR